MGKSGGIRLYVDEALGDGQAVSLSRDQSHYLFNVMRCGIGDQVNLFNGRDGEWHAEVVKAGKSGVLACQARNSEQAGLADIWLLFAPVRKARNDLIVEKAVELGVARIMPVSTDYTNSDRVRIDRMEKTAIEAAEQSGGVNLPQIDAVAKLRVALDGLEAERILIVLNEAEDGDKTRDILADCAPPVAMLVGPEGGFSPAELEYLAGRANTVSISLGPRILRADTAVVSGLTLVQSQMGDWQ